MKKLNFNLYKKMLFFRLVEEEISKRYSERKMRCPTHLSIGQEAVSAAFSQLVKKNDYAVSSHRPHLHYLAKGGDLKKMIAEIYGKKTGCSGGKGGSMHLIDTNVNFMGSSAIVGNSIPIGTGLALSTKIKKQKKKSFIFFGEGAVEQGVFYESLNFAAVQKIPAVFMCENNLYSVYSSLKDRQPKNRKNHEMVKSIGVRSFFVDGNDVIKCYKKLKEVISFVSKENKPAFIEFYTYRYLEHCGPNNDDDLNYRPLKEINYWKSRDPLEILKKSFDNNMKDKIEFEKKKITFIIEEAFNYAEKSKPPVRSDIYKNIYA